VIHVTKKSDVNSAYFFKMHTWVLIVTMVQSIQVALIHSLSGSYSVERDILRAEQLAIEKINTVVRPAEV
jgi:hypothetical protein